MRKDKFWEVADGEGLGATQRIQLDATGMVRPVKTEPNWILSGSPASLGEEDVEVFFWRIDRIKFCRWRRYLLGLPGLLRKDDGVVYGNCSVIELRVAACYYRSPFPGLSRAKPGPRAP